MAGIHDVGYKCLFSNRTIFRQLLETFVPEAWVKAADFEAAETLDKSYISDHFKATESDLLYKVPLRDSEVYIYILLEFQSTVPRFMALRVPYYQTSFYMDYVKSGSRIRKLPPIFPIVLYNGERRWTAPTSLEPSSSVRTCWVDSGYPSSISRSRRMSSPRRRFSRSGTSSRRCF